MSDDGEEAELLPSGSGMHDLPAHCDAECLTR